MSKGSEMVLVAASMFSDVSCIIVRVPSYFVSEGLIGNGKNKAPSIYLFHVIGHTLTILS